MTKLFQHLFNPSNTLLDAGTRKAFLAQAFAPPTASPTPAAFGGRDYSDDDDSSGDDNASPKRASSPSKGIRAALTASPVALVSSPHRAPRSSPGGEESDGDSGSESEAESGSEAEEEGEDGEEEEEGADGDAKQQGPSLLGEAALSVDTAPHSNGKATGGKQGGSKSTSKSTSKSSASKKGKKKRKKKKGKKQRRARSRREASPRNTPSASDSTAGTALHVLLLHSCALLWSLTVVAPVTVIQWTRRGRRLCACFAPLLPWHSSHAPEIPQPWRQCSTHC